MPDILGALSFVIVDDKEVIFAIPMAGRLDTSEPKALQLGTGVVFTDPDGSLVKEMLNLFDDLLLNADEIVVVSPDGGGVRLAAPQVLSGAG